MTCQKCGGSAAGAQCVLCGYLEGERLALQPPPEEPDPDGLERPFTCRYCNVTLDSARAVAEHQASRHPGVGLRLVTDAREWWEAG